MGQDGQIYNVVTPRSPSRVTSRVPKHLLGNEAAPMQPIPPPSYEFDLLSELESLVGIVPGGVALGDPDLPLHSQGSAPPHQSAPNRRHDYDHASYNYAPTTGPSSAAAAAAAAASARHAGGVGLMGNAHATGSSDQILADEVLAEAEQMSKEGETPCLRVQHLLFHAVAAKVGCIERCDTS